MSDERPLRRATDRWTDDRLDDAIERFERELTLLSPLPNAVGKLSTRLDRAERDIEKIDIGAALDRVEKQMESLHAKLDADMEGLKEQFIPRAEMPALYVPRVEHEKRWQMKLQWPQVLLAVMMIVSQMVLLLRGLH